MLELTIQEDMTKNSITGAVFVSDTLNLIKNVPIIGNETLRISYRTPTTESVVREFQIYKISKRVAPTGTGVMTYSLLFASKEFFSSLSSQFSKAFQNIPYSTMALSVYETYIKNQDNPKPFYYATTLGSKSLTLPYVHPFEAIEMFAAKSMGKDQPDLSNFVFYESKDGFFFVPYNHFAVGDNANKVEQEYRYYLPNMTFEGKTFFDDFARIESYDIEESHNTLRNIAEGVFSASLLTYDTIAKKATTTTYGYNFDFYSSPHQEQFGILPSVNENFSENLSSIRMFVPKASYKFDNVRTMDDYEDVILTRNAQILGRDQFRINFVVAGDSRRTVGQCIRISINSNEPLGKSDLIEDPYLSGKYIIDKLTHMIRQDTHKMIISAVKDSSSAEYPNKKNT
jgi:hypothetical protein